MLFGRGRNSVAAASRSRGRLPLTNSAVNFLHVKSGDAIDANLPARMGAFTVATLPSGFVMALAARAMKLPAAERWAT